MRIPRIVVLTLVPALVLLSACSDDGGDGGGGDGGAGDGGAGGEAVSAEAYVQDLCSSVQTWVDDVTALSTGFSSGVDPSAPIEDQKQAILDFLDEAIVLTDSLIEEVDAAGTPDVEGGRDVVSAVRQAFDQTRGILEDARARVEAASTEDPQAFADELNQIGSTIQGSLGNIAGALAVMGSPELANAASEEPACQELVSATGV